MSDELFEMISRGDAEVIGLVDADPSLIRARNGSGASPILFAACYSRKDIVAELARRAGGLDPADAVAAGNLGQVRIRCLDCGRSSWPRQSPSFWA